MRVDLGNRRPKAWIFLAGLIVLISPDLARAQPYEVPETWGGDIWSRPRLTGDWGGLRDELAKMGVVFDVDLLGTPQDVVSGGRSTGSGFWGNIDYTLNIDTQKLGLWPGGFFKFQGDTGFGSNVFKNAGTIVPVNTAALIPGINDQTTALMNATLTQFLSPQFALFAGGVGVVVRERPGRRQDYAGLTQRGKEFFGQGDPGESHNLAARQRRDRLVLN